MQGEKRAKKKPLVLLVDDDESLRLPACAALERAGFAVVEAHSAELAYQIARASQPQLILVDLAMPESGGYEVCETLRTKPETEHTPIVTLTGDDDAASIDRAFDAGATDFIAKPINWRSLVHRVRYLLRASQTFERFRTSELLLANAQRAARFGSWEWNTTSDEMRWSEQVFQLLGLQPSERATSFARFQACVHPEDREPLHEQLEEARRLGGRFEVEHRIELPGGVTRFVSQSGEVNVEALDGHEIVVGVMQDITERRQTQERIRYLANYDSLTGLCNRRLFIEQVSRAVRAGKARGHVVSLIYIDVDRFKRVNDTMGHSVGDDLLRGVAQHLQKHVRASDVVARVGEETPGSASVSRLGGDEFAVLLPNVRSEEDPALVARRVLKALEEPIPVAGRNIHVTCSLGIALCPSDTSDPESLIRDADTAMYNAKKQGGNRYEFFSPEQNAAVLRKHALEAQLREALARGELACVYQPRVDFRSRRVTGVEALLRWQSSELGRVSPAEFIPIAEDSGLIIPIGDWVLRRACLQSRIWQDAGFGLESMSVNVSVRQFSHGDVLESVVRALDEAGLAPSRLELEITESLMLQDDEATLGVLRNLRDMGVRISLDDFGTGYSSLSYLSRLPLDTLKLDRSFVHGIGLDPGAEGILAAVVAMAHSMRIRVVAEGVSTDAQARFLRDQDCDEMQGFLFSPAVTQDEFGELMPVELEIGSSPGSPGGE